MFIHGFREHIARRYTEAHTQFAAWGVNEIAPRAEHKSTTSSYGKTSGAVGYRAHIQGSLYAEASQVNPGLPIFLSGHSMGGGEVLDYSIRHGASSLSGIVASSAPVLLTPKPVLTSSPPATINVGEMQDTADPNRVPLTWISMPSRMTMSIMTYDVINAKHKIKLTSSTAVKDFHDKIIADDKTLILYTDGYHEFVQEPAHKDKVMDNMVAFIEQHSSRATRLHVHLILAQFT
ncbi:hypothetical protein DFH07DRAFT_777567 [Mycena maculata]|uniref:Serine aminopeptidase S33 domain-containing protein n=1 Tax=Mycena maculata TaxID=230809 RepID=A0AAD7IH08_9AGAR|nr:hypothetical protein DFH07DRAFT_777567 [Mycena maculata]